MTQSYDYQPLGDLAEEVYQINLANGWFDPTKPARSFGEDIALLHSEVSEAFEGYRNGDWANVVEELVDVQVRLLDTVRRLEMRDDVPPFDFDSEFAKKLEKNRSRGYRHGGKVV